MGRDEDQRRQRGRFMGLLEPGHRARALGRAHRHRHIHAAPLLERRVLAVVAGRLDLIVRLPELGRRDIVQAAHGVAAAARQPGIDGRRDVEGLPVRRADRGIAAHVVAVEPPLVPLNFR